MSRRGIQVVFILVGIAWMAFFFIDWLANIYGDCGDDKWCEGRKSIAAQLAFWRGLSIAILIVSAYRYFRKDPE